MRFDPGLICRAAHRYETQTPSVWSCFPNILPQPMSVFISRVFDPVGVFVRYSLFSFIEKDTRRIMSVQPASALAQVGKSEIAPGFGTTEYGRMLERPGPGRPLVYPYSYNARFLQFPWKLNWQRNWLFRYYFYGWLAGLPLVYTIHKMANSPANVENWKRIREQWRQEALGNVKH